MQELRNAGSSQAAVDEDIRSEIEQADRRFGEAIARGDAEGAAREVYSEDAVILPPGADIVRGRDNIVSFWRDAARDMSLEKVELSTVELQQAGDFVHQVGRALLVAGGQEIRGKYTVLWKREDGRWKWHIDCWNTNS